MNIRLSSAGLLVAMSLAATASFAQQGQCSPPLTQIQVSETKTLAEAYRHLECTSDFKTSDDAINAGISLGTLVYGVPLRLGMTFSKETKESWKHEHCESTEKSSQFSSAYSAVMTLVSSEAYDAWKTCTIVNAPGVNCWFERPSEAEDSKATLRVKWTPLPEDRGPRPKVLSSNVDGATTKAKPASDVPFPRRMDVTANPVVNLNRDTPGGSVSAMVNTNRGSCTAYLRRAEPQWTTEYLDVDPQTHLPYALDFAFEKNEHYYPSKDNAQPRGDNGHRVLYVREFAGPVSSVTCDAPSGRAGGWTHVDVCAKEGNKVTWDGWANSADPAEVAMHVKYKMPQKVCVKYCEANPVVGASSK